MVVTLDTGGRQRPAVDDLDPTTFSSVLDAVPKRLTPLFNRHGVVPTYLISLEVLEQPACVETLAALGTSAELGAHLHDDFVEPGRKLFLEDMGGRANGAIQKQLSPDVEAQKLETLTAAFEKPFGRRRLPSEAAGTA